MIMWHNQDLLDMSMVGTEIVYGTQQVIIHNGRSVSVSMDGGKVNSKRKMKGCRFSVLNCENAIFFPLRTK